ncbi:MAG: asparagine synthase-related protein, partial [Fidelibacterota bacterium]
MCGIFAYLGGNLSWKELRDHAYKIKYRGPENTHIIELNNNSIFTFHRLAIMGVSETGDQPMQHPQDPSLTLICNGEIYNYLELAEKYGFTLETGSDCEIILFLYKKFGIEQTVRELDGVFMFVLYDDTSKTFYVGRDPMGVRPGFIGKKGVEIFIASEAKPMVGICDSIQPFPPGCWWSSRERNFFHRYFHYSNNETAIGTEDEICDRICELLSHAVEKRMMAEREIGCLLSGGLDSSLITALVAQHNNGNMLKTFSIGIPGSIDLEYAQSAADHLGTIHHQIEMSEEDFLEAIKTVIYNIESYDTTTVRASVGNYLVSRFIRENSDCKVVFNGDGSDEVCCGYVYLKNATSPDALQKESERLVKELYLFDVLRSDRSISSNGLEARTPFLDKTFVRYYLSIPAELKM